jgi:hypothetical protein
VLVRNFTVPDEEITVEMSTDGGATFAPLSPTLYNLTSSADEAQLGAGRRLFQYLGKIPPTATGSSAFAFRLRSTGPIVPTIPLFSGTLAGLLTAALLAMAGARRLRGRLSAERSERRETP